MSINSNMKSYTLQILERVRDPIYSHVKEDWVNIGTIEVAINETYHNSTSDDGTFYRRRVVTGITRYTYIAKDRKYRIVHANNCYEIEDFIKGRMIQLQLKEVLGYKKSTKFNGSLNFDDATTFDGDYLDGKA